MQTIKLFYTDDGRLLFSRKFPESPNWNMVELAKYVVNMEEALRHAVPLLNPEKAFELIALKEPLERGKIYEVCCDYETYDGQVQVLDPIVLPNMPTGNPIL